MASEPREIRSVLSTVFFSDDEVDQLRRAFAPAEYIHLSPGDKEGIAAALAHVDVAVLWGDLDERFLDAPNLRWVHCDHAGLTRSAKPEYLERGLIITGSAGRSAPALAQHAFYFALALTFDARRLFEMQAAHIWHGIPGYHDKVALAGKTLGIVGFGHTGKAMAELGRAFGMRVMTYSRSAQEQHPAVDTMLAAERGDSLDRLIDESDVIMLAAPLNDATHHMFSRPQFERMKDHAFLINLGRGGLIDQDALIDALERGWIAGAGLDVTDPEPLPADSRLWDAPNVIITPHVTPKMPDRTQRSIDIIVENARRYRAGESLINALTERDLFSK